MAFCGGNPDGGLGTNVPLIIEAINQVWSPKGVAILVDLGGAETNSEMAVEMLQPERRDRVVVCNAPIVEGAVMAATEAAGGSSLEQVRDRGRRIVRGVNANGRGSIEDAMTLESANGRVDRQCAARARRRHARAAGGEADQARQEISGALFIRASDAAEWINAKSVAKVMALRAARDSIIQIRASGEDAEGAVAALVDLVAADFPDNAS